MEYLKENAAHELAVQRLEKIMDDLGISIEAGSKLVITVNYTDYRLLDIESYWETTSFPRMLNTEKMVLDE